MRRLRPALPPQRVSATSWFLSCPLTLLAGVPRAQPQSGEAVEMQAPVLRGRARRKLSLPGEGGRERMEPQLTPRLERHSAGRHLADVPFRTRGRKKRLLKKERQQKPSLKFIIEPDQG